MIGVDDVEQECLECGYKCCNRRSLGNHVARSHKELGGLEGYVLKFFTNGEVPLCICGCGKPVAWQKTMYHYSDYISGHNRAGFGVKQPEFTQEQIDKRNASIRKTYAERGDEINGRISDSLKDTFAEKKANGFSFSDYFNEKWADPAFCESQHKGRVASWQGEAGEERRQKVFTPEFGRKIAEANMRRDNKKTSKVEAEFVQRLRDVGFVVEDSKWFNFTEKTWCADAWLPELGVMVEFDGAYWHGLDRDSDYSHDQLINATNDVIKNRLARDKGLTLIRIAEGTDVDGLLPTLESLIEHAYHAVVKGEVVKEGTFSIHELKPVIKRETLIRMHLDGHTDDVEKDFLPLVTKLFQECVAYWGWFYPVSDDDLNTALVMLASVPAMGEDGVLVSPGSAHGRAGSDWLKSRAHSFWNVDGGPARAFHDAKRLNAVLRYRLGLNNSKPYDYTLSDGVKVQCKETFDINLKNVRRGFIVQHNSVSWFRPAWAAQVYKMFLGGIESPVVWDPSIGFSARLLGFAAVIKDGKYIGTDPASIMYADAKAVALELSASRPGLSIDLRQQGSEMCELPHESVDLVFTSPPYFDIEKYVDESGQCWRDHPTLEGWAKEYLLPTFRIAHASLRPDRFMVINIDAAHVDLVVAAAEQVGFTYVRTMSLTRQRDHFARSVGIKEARSEPFLVFKK